MPCNWKTVRVFISSTFRDMHAERDHLVKVVFPKLRQWCERRRLHLVDIDLRWGVTEAEANNGKAIDICLKEIDGSRPFFVCILGGRYGWVPEALPPEERYRYRSLQKAANCSITHLEILHATDEPIPTVDGNKSEVCSHAFFFLRKDGCIPPAASLVSLTDAQRQQHDETYFEQVHPRELVELKQWIHDKFEKTGQVQEYTGDWDAQAENPEEETGQEPTERLVGRVTNLDRFGRLVTVQLRRAIRHQFAEHIRDARLPVDPLVEERSFHEAFIENRTQVHIPRVQIEKKLTNNVQSPDHRLIVLSGPPGSGKSAILAHWLKENVDPITSLANWDRKTFVIPRFIGASSASTNLVRLLGNICTELVQRFELQEEIEVDVPDGTKTKRTQTMEVPLDPALLQAKWPKVLEAAASRGPVLLVLDALNQLDRSAEPLRPYWLPHKLPPGLRIVVSVLDHGKQSLPNTLDRKPMARTSADTADWLAVLRRRDVQEVLVEKLVESEQRELIRQLPSVVCKTLDEVHIHTLVKNAATTNPLFLIVALEELRVFGGFKTLSEKITKLPQLVNPTASEQSSRTIDDALNELFGQVLDRLDWEAAKRGIAHLVPTLFRLLASAKEGLSERELRELLARLLTDSNDRQRQGEMQVVLRQVRNYLMRKGPLLDFYHRSFWKAVQAKYLKTELARHDAHSNVADFFNDEPYLYPDRQPNERKVTELPWQRLQMVHEARVGELATELPSACDCLEQLFEDIFFLEAKNQTGLVFELATEFTHCVEALPKNRPHRRIVKLLNEALRRDIQFIHRHYQDYPQGLFQCLWNNGWWYDCPEVGKHFNETTSGWSKQDPFWAHTGEKLSTLLEKWRKQRAQSTITQPWIRSLRPPVMHLGTAQVAVMHGHHGAVCSVAFSPDGKRIVSSSDDHLSGNKDNTLRIWDALSGAELDVLYGHEWRVESVTYSPDGSRIVSGSWDKTVRVWDADSGQELFVLRGHDHSVCSVAYSPDGSRIVSASNDATICIWDANSGIKLAVLRGHEGGVWSVAYSPDGSRIVSGSTDNTVRIWDVGSGKETQVFRGHDDAVRSVVFSPNGKSIVSGSNDKTVRVWDSDSGTEVTILRGHSEEIWCVACSPDGTRIATASDRIIRLWSFPSGKECIELRGHEYVVACVAWSPDSRLLASGAGKDRTEGDTTVRVWDTTDVAELMDRQSHQDQVICISYSPDGSRIATGSLDKTVRVWEADSGRELFGLQGHDDAVWRVIYSPNGCRIASASFDKTVRVWDADNGATIAVLHGHGDNVRCIAFAPDGKRIVSGSDDSTMRLWETETGKEKLVLRDLGWHVDSVIYSTNGNRIAIASSDWIFLLDVERHPRSWFRSAVSCMYRWISHLFVGKSPIIKLCGHKTEVTSVAWSPDDSMLASGSTDHTVRLWDAQTGAALAVLHGHKDMVSGVAFSRDGRRIASAAWFTDQQTRVWDVESRACVKIIQGRGDLNAIAAGASVFPWCAIRKVEDEETMIVEAEGTGKAVAWFPVKFINITTHPTCPQWTGSRANQIYIVALEDQ